MTHSRDSPAPADPGGATLASHPPPGPPAPPAPTPNIRSRGDLRGPGERPGNILAPATEALDRLREVDLPPLTAGQGSGLSRYHRALWGGGYVARVRDYLNSVLNGEARFVGTHTIAEAVGLPTGCVGGCLAALAEDPDFSVVRWSKRCRGRSSTWRLERR